MYLHTDVSSWHKVIPYIGNFSCREILAKMMIERCVKFSQSPILLFQHSQWRRIVWLIFAVSIFCDFWEVANSVKIKPTRKIPDIWYVREKILISYNFTPPQPKPNNAITILVTSCWYMLHIKSVVGMIHQKYENNSRICRHLSNH